MTSDLSDLSVLPDLPRLARALEREYAALQAARDRWAASGDPDARQEMDDRALRCAVLGAALARQSRTLMAQS